MLRILLKPWVIAAGSAASAYLLSKRQKDQKSKLREAKLELLEQQRTIDRLRAELGKERALRQQDQEKFEDKIDALQQEDIQGRSDKDLEALKESIEQEIHDRVETAEDAFES